MSKQVTLYTAGTPNGFPISIVLEELGISCRIPAIVDHTNNDFYVFETSAILLYLTARFDKEHKISYDSIKESNLYSEELQWLFFAHGGIGPMQGQATHFVRYAPEKIPYGIKRYVEETKRLFTIIEKRLQGRDWLVGDHYGLADIKTFPWVRLGPWSGVALDEFPNIQAWISRAEARSGTDAGLAVPARQNLQAMLEKAEEISSQTRANFGFKKE
ncbi:hypothetical protein Clacol_002974 [Clathrus columnatus]|uniref:GST C-terminal domain-containing protein n=1 Tax=Clathrus columnatus TaxID=1419009 RepID=A0AAV5AA11_9AGAM|nr:hypothetical protein Clacol_002974 [Clathrus columnatus]